MIFCNFAPEYSVKAGKVMVRIIRLAEKTVYIN